MGLFSSLNIGKNALLAQQRGLDVVGQNISNANTEGYSRQRIEFSSLPPSRSDFLFFGNGVTIKDVRRIFDQQVENRLQRALSTLGSLSKQNEVYGQLESSINALGDDPANGIYVTVGGQLDQLFNELNNLSADPSDAALRSVAVSQFDSFGKTVSYLANDIMDLRGSLNESVESEVRDLNRMITQIAELNDEIVRAEVGGTVQGKANDLRDQRDLLVRNLSEITNISVVETPTGSIDVRVAGNLLVSGNDYFALETSIVADRGVDISTVEFQMNGSTFTPREGELGGLLIARDEILTSFMGDLDNLARTMISEFNKVHSTGRGTVGLSKVESQEFTSTHALLNQLPMSIQGTVSSGNSAGTYLSDPSLKNFPNGTGDANFFVGAKVLFTSGENDGRSATITAYDPGSGRLDLDPPFINPISAADTFEITSFDYPIENGSFKLNLRNDATGITDVFDIEIDRDGLPLAPNLDDTSLQNLVDDINTQLNTFYGGNSSVAASISTDYKLVIESTQSDVTFSFSDDTSGFLAAAGMNTLFKGKDALSIDIHQAIQNNPSLFAGATSAIAGDNANIIEMLNLSSQKLFLDDTTSVQDFYNGAIGTLAVEAATARELADNQELIAQAASNARERISGVNIDEEAIDLIRFQRSFQAASRYLSAVDSMLQELLAII